MTELCEVIGLVSHETVHFENVLSSLVVRKLNPKARKDKDARVDRETEVTNGVDDSQCVQRVRHALRGDSVQQHP